VISDRCQRIKVDTKRKNPPLTPLPVVGPFERWNMNFLKLSKTKDGYLYLFLMVDSFTKWVEAFPMKTQEESEVAQIIFREIIARFGCPRILVSDRGRNFMSTLVLSLCEVFDIARQHTSSYRLQANGLVERANSTLIKSFRAYCVIRTSIIGLRNFL
jgi:transposase InsO family protein